MTSNTITPIQAPDIAVALIVHTEPEPSDTSGETCRIVHTNGLSYLWDRAYLADLPVPWPQSRNSTMIIRGRPRGWLEPSLEDRQAFLARRRAAALQASPRPVRVVVKQDTKARAQATKAAAWAAVEAMRAARAPVC